MATDSLAGAYGILAGESDFTQRPNEPVKTGHLKIKIPNAAGTPEEKEFKLPFELYVPQSEDIIGQDKEFVHRLCVEGTLVRSAAHGSAAVTVATTPRTRGDIDNYLSLDECNSINVLVVTMKVKNVKQSDLPSILSSGRSQPFTVIGVSQSRSKALA